MQRLKSVCEGALVRKSANGWFLEVECGVSTRGERLEEGPRRQGTGCPYAQAPAASIVARGRDAGPKTSEWCNGNV